MLTLQVAAAGPSISAAQGVAPVMTRAALTQLPSSRQMASFYPPDALRQRRTGRAVIRCVVDRSGLLSDCQVVSASEPAFGFATLRISGFFRARPATRDGEPVEGRITLPVVWKIGG
jgi:periplasmic protein TonB